MLHARKIEVDVGKTWNASLGHSLRKKSRILKQTNSRSDPNNFQQNKQMSNFTVVCVSSSYVHRIHPPASEVNGDVQGYPTKNAIILVLTGILGGG